mgnify:CR=1 FL=1
MIGARSSALAMDNLVDLKFDKQQNRMSKRPLVTGAIKPIEVIILIIVSLCIFLYSASQLASYLSKINTNLFIFLIILSVYEKIYFSLSLFFRCSFSHGTCWWIYRCYR